MKDVLELKRLNDHEANIILAALEHLANSEDRRYGSGARILLEDDAAFVRGLFWTSRIADRKQDV